MTKYGIDSTVICQIIDLANRHHIKTVILFGSRARGDFCRTSSLTILVIISQNNYTTKRYIHKRKRKIVVETSAELHRI